MKTPIKVVGIIILLTIVFALVFGPNIAKEITVKNSKEWLGRSIALEKINVNLLTGTIKLFDFKMYEQNDTAVFIKFDTLVLNAEPYKYLSQTIVIEGFYLSGLFVNIEQHDSLFNFDDLTAFYLSSDTTMEKDTIEEESFKFILDDFRIAHSDFSYHALKINSITELNNFGFYIPHLAWDQEEQSFLNLSFNLNKNAKLGIKTNLNQVTGDFTSEISVTQLNFNNFEAFVKKEIKINKIEGLFNADIKLNGNISSLEDIVISSQTNLSDFMLTDTANIEFFGIKKLDVTVSEAKPKEMEFIVDKIDIDELYTYFYLTESTNNLMEIFNLNIDTDSLDTSTVKPKTDSIDQPPLYYHIKELNIENSKIDYVDNITGKEFEYHLSSIEMNSRDLKSTNDWLEIHSEMVLNNRGNLNADLRFNPSDFNNIKLDFEVEKFLLSDLNIYANYYIGHNILKGDMFYYSKTTIENGIIDSENKLIIKEANVDNNKSGIVKMPLKFALFLLEDKDGVIKFDVPVRGDLNDPELNIGKIAWTTFKNLVVKVVTSPSRALSNLAGDKNVNIDTLFMNYNDTILNETLQKQLNTLVQIETKKPGLAIDLVYNYSPKEEKETILYSEAMELYNHSAEKHKNDSLKFIKYLMKKTSTNSDDFHLYSACEKISSPLSVDSLIVIYKNKRIQSVLNYIKQEDISSQIKTCDAKSDTLKIRQGFFKVQYGMY